MILNPKVAIWMITYNHEDYIAEAIESIMMQKTNFEFKLFIGEDCSTDATKEICLSLWEKYPNNIELILHPYNLGHTKNGRIMYEKVFSSNADYIAMCEGDDYWTDPLKLQKQVDFLELNPEFSICSTDYCILYEINKTVSPSGLMKKLGNRRDFSLKNIITSNFIPTLTVLFRNNNIVFPDNIHLVYPGDWALHILNAQYGKIKFLPIVTAVYRKHDTGICSSVDPIDNYKKYLTSLVLIRRWFQDASFVIRLSFFYARILIYKDILKYFIKTKLIRWVK